MNDRLGGDSNHSKPAAAAADAAGFFCDNDDNDDDRWPINQSMSFTTHVFTATLVNHFFNQLLLQRLGCGEIIGLFVSKKKIIF